MKKKIKKVIIFFIIILIVMAVLAYAYIYTDVLKTEKQLFIKYLINNVKQLEEINVEPYGSVFSQNENENIQIKNNLQVTLKEGDEVIKSTMDYNIFSDVKQKKASITFDSKMNDDEYLKFDIIVSDEILGIKIGGIYDKYLSFKNENLKEVIKKFGIEEKELEKIPDKIDFSKQLNMTDEEIEKNKNIFKRYSNIFLELLEKGEYQKSKDVKVEINKQTFITNKYNFNISEKEVKKAIITFADGVINDQEFINMYLYDLDSEVLKEFRDGVKETIKEIEAEENDSKIVIGVYEAEGKTIKTDVIVEDTEMYIAILNNEFGSNIEISTKEQTPENEKLYMPDCQNVIRIQNSVSGTNGKLTIEIENKYDKDDIEKLNQQEKEEYEEYDFGNSTDYSKWYEDSSTKFAINAVKKDDKNIELSMDLKDLETTVDMDFIENLEMKLKTVITFGNNVKIEELNDENALILNEYSAEDFTKLGLELATNIEKTMEENPNWLFSQLGQVDGVLLESENTSEETRKKQVQATIRESLQLTIADGLANYYSDVNRDENISRAEYIANFLNLENIRRSCGNSIKELEILEDNIFKVTYEDDKIYFVKVSLIENEGNIKVDNVEAFTEEEYNQ